MILVRLEEETVGMMFELLTREKKEDYDREVFEENYKKMEEELRELKNFHEYGEDEWQKEKREVAQSIEVRAGKFFPEKYPPESLTLFGKIRHLLQVLEELEIHEKINRRCQTIVLALTAIDPKAMFVVHCKRDEKFTGTVVKVQNGVLHIRQKSRSIKKIDLKSVIEVVLTEGKEDKKK